MDEYIKRETAVKAANEWVSEACMASVMRVSRLFDKLQKVPAADVAPVVHGRWNSMDGYKMRVVCSVCGWDVPEYGKFYSYCPNCGAKMGGGDGDAAD